MTNVMLDVLTVEQSVYDLNDQEGNPLFVVAAGDSRVFIFRSAIGDEPLRVG